MSAALDSLHLIHKSSPSLSCLLLLQQENLLPPHALSSSCCLLHPKTLSRGLAELRLLAHFRVCAVPGIQYVSDVSPWGDALKSWSLVWNGRVETSKRQGLSGCYWVTDYPQELTLPSSQKRLLGRSTPFSPWSLTPHPVISSSCLTPTVLLTSIRQCSQDP